MSGRLTPERLGAIREMVEDGVLDDHVGTLREVFGDRDALEQALHSVQRDLCRAWARLTDGGHNDPREHAKDMRWTHLVFDELEEQT
jgi:hypothetical protein